MVVMSIVEGPTYPITLILVETMLVILFFFKQQILLDIILIDPTVGASCTYRAKDALQRVFFHFTNFLYSLLVL